MPVTHQLSMLAAGTSVAARPEDAADFGEVFTKRWVVDFILDLVGYTPDRDLSGYTIVEPSCGAGAFLGPIVERLAESCRRHGRKILEAADAIRAFDLLEVNAELARKATATHLIEDGLDPEQATPLADHWVRAGDFLLTEHAPETADFVVGNPPYIRLEGVSSVLTDAYRAACKTMRGRSDIYVGFFEVGLELLKPGGQLAYICADRWMHNQYGSTLREFVTSKWAVDTVVAMHDVDAFEDDVSAYPAITVLRNGPQRRAQVVEAKAAFDVEAAQAVTRWVRNPRRQAPRSTAFDACRLDSWHTGPGLWPSGSPAQLALLADLERRFAPLEDRATGTKVGIGVATGCDDVYITTDSELVEPDRLLPLLRAGDLQDGTPDWSGQYLVNPWHDRELVDLRAYPKLRRYLESHAGRLKQRHTAQKQLGRWYRTIDVVEPTLRERPKLVLPDMKAAAHPVLDTGQYYPHHNLYFVVSEAWDLEVLGGLLLSDVANLFVGAYCVKMRGGCYRFQAQYIRQIRVPSPDDVPARIGARLADAFRRRDRSGATRLACELYEVKPDSLGYP